MTKFTTDNTDGFTAADLAALNAAYARIMASVDPEFDATTNAVSDSLNNAWFEGATADDLVRIVGPKFA